MQGRDLIQVGAYVAGADPELDVAIKLMPKLKQYLAQGMDEKVGYTESVVQLMELFNAG